uniref:Uncharacterized protein n=1 Tax=Octopus bimaculoides TaxID=37653 RepID=A0A0L8GXR5_OCTBM
MKIKTDEVSHGLEELCNNTVSYGLPIVKLKNYKYIIFMADYQTFIVHMLEGSSRSQLRDMALL